MAPGSAVSSTAASAMLKSSASNSFNIGRGSAGSCPAPTQSIGGDASAIGAEGSDIDPTRSAFVGRGKLRIGSAEPISGGCTQKSAEEDVARVPDEEDEECRKTARSCDACGSFFSTC